MIYYVSPSEYEKWKQLCPEFVVMEKAKEDYNLLVMNLVKQKLKLAGWIII